MMTWINKWKNLSDNGFITVFTVVFKANVADKLDINLLILILKLTLQTNKEQKTHRVIVTVCVS